MSSMTITRRLILFTLIVAVGLVASVGLQSMTLNQLKIRGPIYQDIVNEKDLIADILPPPLFVIEPYLLLTENVVHPERLADNLARLAALRRDYESRKAYWKTVSMTPDERHLLEEGVIRTADAFWADVDRDFDGGAAKAGDGQALTRLMALFYQHREAVERLVAATTGHLARSEADSVIQGNRLQGMALAGSAVSVMLFMAGVFLIRRRVVRPVTQMTGVMESLARGDFDVAVPHAQRNDEIGRMAKTLAVFRDAGRDNLRLQAEAEAASRQRARDRAEREAEKAEEAARLMTVIDRLGAGLKRLSECNIRMTIDEPFAAQFERMRTDFNSSIGAFQDTLEQVLASTHQLQASSEEMRDAAHDMADRTEAQAQAVERTAAAIEEIATTIKQSADRASDTRLIVREAKVCAEQSAGIVRDAVEAMHAIEAASREIGHIIGVIDEIAFQTNLLALNAGVEAARAGEAGKGFAVVAQEVRELAQRSAGAAKEIKQIIIRSEQAVTTGVNLVSETGAALRSIGERVSTVDGNMDAIATSVTEQSAAIGDISSALHEIDQMTQHNAAMAEQSTGLSQTLADGAAQLGGLVGRFQLNRRKAIRDAAEAGQQAPIAA